MSIGRSLYLNDGMQHDNVTSRSILLPWIIDGYQLHAATNKATLHEQSGSHCFPQAAPVRSAQLCVESAQRPPA